MLERVTVKHKQTYEATIKQMEEEKDDDYSVVDWLGSPIIGLPAHGVRG
jgi:hypothetical protein